MQKTPLPNLHDASVGNFTYFSDAARLIISVSKYAIDDKPAFEVELLFSGIKNPKKVTHFDQCIRRVLQKEKRCNLGYRIDNLSYYDSLLSEEGLGFVLDIDHLGSLQIICRKLSVRKI